MLAGVVPAHSYAEEIGEAVSSTGTESAYESESSEDIELSSISDPGYSRTGVADYAKALEEFNLINAERKKNGVSALVMNKELQATAMQRAAELSVSYSHTRPDGRSDSTAYPSSYSSWIRGENIAWGFSSASRVTDAWMDSLIHCANILSLDYTCVGIGCFKYNGYYYWVQCFGVGMSQSYAGTTARTQTFNIPLVYMDGIDSNETVMFRMYNPYSGEHFYTAQPSERNSLLDAGWTYEGVGWVAPTSSNAPVYRLYSGTDHHYTTSAEERDMLVRVGWRYEGAGWYSAETADRIAVYRQFNPNVNPRAKWNNSGSHNYTTSKFENDQLVNAGWRAEGIGWYSCNYSSN